MRARLFLVEDVECFRIRECLFKGREIKSQRQVCAFFHGYDPGRAKREAKVCLRALRKSAAEKRARAVDGGGK